MHSRRSFLATFAFGTSLPFIAFDSWAQKGMQALPLTPRCTDGDEPTVAQTPGPFYLPNSPLKRDFAADAPGGEPILLQGLVRDSRCRPIAGALIELWHADQNGDYDTVGFRLRGHQFADANGRWSFATIVPAPYPGRTRHFHLRAQPPDRAVLTTQLYFPGETRNARDSLFDERLLLKIRQRRTGKVGRFDIVL
jgi:protocatechuate 3,4-dioxygenase beta subunit